MADNNNLHEEELTPEEEIQDDTPDTSEAPEAGEAPEADESAAEIEALRAEADRTKDAYLRTLAEYDNYRKRSEKEKRDAYSAAISDTVVEFLTVIDNFERALLAETADEAYKNGMTMIFNQYTAILEKLGVKEIPAEGQPFDPNLHNAVSSVADDSFGENTVCQVLQKGYCLGDKVIRHAMVVVANP